MISGEDLMQSIVAALEKIGDAKKNLTDYLKLHIRPEILDKVRITSMVLNLDSDEDIREEAVDMAIDNDLGGKLSDNLVGTVAHKRKIEIEEADDVILPYKRLSDEAKKILDELKDELAKICYNYISKALISNKEKWKQKKEKEEELKKKEPEQQVLPEQEEIEEELKKAPKFEIKDIEKLIDRQYSDEKKNSVSKKILHEMLINKSKTLDELEKETGIDRVSIHRLAKGLIKLIEKHLIEKGVARPKKEETPEKSVPDYKGVLKNEVKQKDFENFLEKNKTPRMSERTIKVLEALVKGLDVAEVSTKTEVAVADIRNIKIRYFDPLYKEWYESMEEKTARIAALFLGAEEEKNTGAIHKKMVDWGLEHNRFIATIVFESEYDNLEVISGKKDPVKDPPHFKYLSYQVELSETRGGKKQRSIEYEYKQRLNDDGSFIGHGDSSLKLDGDRVTGESDLKEKLDNAVEHKIKPEGLLPHKYTGAIYINKKTGKKYHNIHDFTSSFRGISIKDPAQVERLKKHEDLQLKKMMGISPNEINRARKKYQQLTLDLKILKKDKAPIHEIKKLEKQLDDINEFIANKIKTEKDAEILLHKVKEDLTAEEALPEEKRDKGLIKMFQEQIRMLEHMIEERKNKQDSIEDIVKQEEMLRKPEEHVQARIRLSEEDIIPKPESEAVKRLIDILKEYKLGGRPNPNLWLQPDDLVVMAKALRSMAKTTAENQLRELRKKKKEDTVDKRQEITDKETKDMEDALKGFEAYPQDLKKRREEFEKKNPEASKKLYQTKNTTWVNNDSAVETLLSRIKGILKLPAEKDLDEKQRSVKMLEKVKYRALEAFIKEQLTGIGKISDIFAEVPLEVTHTEKETTQQTKIQEEIEKTVQSIKESRGLLEDLRKSMPAGEEDKEVSEEADKAKEMEKEISEMSSYVRKMREHMEGFKYNPAVATAEVLREKTAYFSSLYSVLIGLLWFRHKSVEKSAEDEKPVVEVADKALSRKNVLHEISVLTSKNIWDREAIRQSISRIRAGLGKFVGLYSKAASYDDAGNDEMVFPYAIVNAIEPSHKSLLPADEMHHAQQLVYQFEHSELSKKTKAMGAIAQEDLDHLIKNLSEAYRKETSTEEIEALAKKKGISVDKAAAYLKKLEDGLARHGFREFMEKWQNVLHHSTKKNNRTDLGNRPSHEYERMGKFVEDHLPAIFDISPPEEEPKLPSAGIPTPQKIREEIENAFSRKKPEEMTEGVDFSELFNDVPMGMGGSEKAKGRSRKKVIKPPPPSAVFEEMKDQVVHLIKTQTAQKVVLTVLAIYTHRLKTFLNTIKDEEFINVDDAIDGYVALLKHLYFQILKLNVEPSGKTLNLVKMSPPKGPEESKLERRAVTFTGQPDIPIDTAKEAEDLFDKLKEIYKEINVYIAPDEVGVPPENLSVLTKKGIGKRYLPAGLIDWWPKLQEYEKRKTATMDQLVYRVANNFSGLFEDVENVPANDLMLR